MIRTRVAPSPTGDPHVGTGYIALFNYCLAKAHGGQFILRIEDTDQVRSTAESEARILQSLKWLGLRWDEGPEVGGPHGPYRQSERSDIYRRHVDQLIDAGHAFRCFCTPERLAELRRRQREDGDGYMGYDGHCLGVDPAEAKRRADDGELHVVRMKVPRDGVCVVKDRFRGDIEFEWKTVDMQILLKSDGLPTYHLANVVDDHLMEITHVLRGEEWISSAPKHILLYEYFGWEAPQLAHLPLLRNPDKSKLSKRKNPTSITYYERMGYLPEALLNYLGMMAWTMPDGEEKFTLPQMVENFDIDRVSMGGPVFDIKKLDWLNARYLREDHTPEQFARRAVEWAINEQYMMSIVPLVQQRVERLSDLADMAVHFFQGMPPVTAELLRESTALEEEQLIEMLQIALWRLEALVQWDSEHLSDTLRSTADALDVKFRDFIKPFFVAMSGKQNSTPMFDTMAIVGPDLTRARVRHALDLLGGVSKKGAKRLEKRYQELFVASAEDDDEVRNA